MKQKFKEIKSYILTGISYMIPVIVASGLCMGIGRAFIGADLTNAASAGAAYWLYRTGQLGMSMMVPVLCAYIAYGVAGRAALASGFVIGMVSIEIQAGFIGGMIGGLVVGYLVVLIRKYIKLPKTLQGIMPIIVIPFLATAIAAVLMFGVLGYPIVLLQQTLTNFLTQLSGGSKFLYGGIVGALSAFDFGGPVNKVASAFCNAMLADGNGYPKVCQILASMIPPFGIAISALIAKNKYTKAEKETLKSAVPMGCVMITEGVIPIAARDLVRVVFACVTGSFVAGGLTMIWNIYSELPNGGFLAFPFFNEPMMALLALAIGSVITGVILAIIKKPVTEADEEFDDIGFEVADSELDDLNIVEVD